MKFCNKIMYLILKDFYIKWESSDSFFLIYFLFYIFLYSLLINF